MSQADPATAPVRVGEARRELVARLAGAGVASPQADAARLLAHVLGWSRSDLVVRGHEALPDHAAELIAALAVRREAREPLQLIIGSTGFRGLDLEVRPGVFIPRPESEILAGEAIARTPTGGIVVEPCTGTGAVAVAVAAEADAGTVVATDRSLEAVALARANARRNAVAVTVVEGDLFAPVDPALAGRVDVIVSNPPYLATAELAVVEPEVAHWDPHAALVAGRTGHEVADRLIAGARDWLRPGGWLLLELAESRAPETARRLAARGWEGVDVVPDLTGRPRVVVAQPPRARPR